jgi:hypothetical protein
VESCAPTFSNILQTGRECRVSILEPAGGDIVLQMKLKDVEGNCPMEHIEMSKPINPSSPSLMPTNADLIRFDNAAMCSLCGSHSCESIEDLMFEKDEFTEHTSKPTLSSGLVIRSRTQSVRACGVSSDRVRTHSSAS